MSTSATSTWRRWKRSLSVREQGGGSLIPDGPLNPGVMHTVATGGNDSHLGLYRLETQVTAGNGSLKMSGLGSNMKAKEGNQGRLRLLQGQRQQRQCVDESRRPRLPPAHCRIAQHRPNHGNDPGHIHRTLLRGIGQANPKSDGRAGEHEPRRQHHTRREPRRVPPSRLRCRCQTHPAPDGQRPRHPHHPR
jgi:hypothetical protein